MHIFQIKVYRNGFHTAKPHFFILSRRNNTGKPLEAPCPNCYILITETEEAKDFYFWLSYSLWQGQVYKPYLIGSVIPFARIGEVKKLLAAGATKAMFKQEKYVRSLALLQQFEAQRKVLEKQMKLIHQAKKVIMYQLLKE